MGIRITGKGYGSNNKELLERIASALSYDEHAALESVIMYALGVGPKTGYDITEQSADLILQKETQETLKRLFVKMFENDRAVCTEIQACLEQL